jgi:hypothetical protein
MKIEISPPKALAELGVTTRIVYDTETGNEGGFVYLLKQGLRYLASARASHEFAKIRGPQDEPTGNEPTQEDAQRVLDRVVADLNAETWPERERSERETVDLPTRVWIELLEPKFKGASESLVKKGRAPILVKGRQAREAKDGKPAVAAREAVTTQGLIAQHGSPEAAYRAVNRAFITGLWAAGGKVELTEEDENSITRRSDAGWADLAKKHAAELKARQRSAAKLDDADEVVL